MVPNKLKEELELYNNTSPEITGGDVDADWQDPADGEEAVGGSVVTPDQDIVEELGRALGVTYQDNEPLDPVEKIKKRGQRPLGTRSGIRRRNGHVLGEQDDKLRLEVVYSILVNQPWGAFVYRLGREVLNLERRVRFP